MYFSANWTMRGFTLVDVICPKLPAAKFGKAMDALNRMASYCPLPPVDNSNRARISVVR